MGIKYFLFKEGIIGIIIGVILSILYIVLYVSDFFVEIGRNILIKELPFEAIIVFLWLFSFVLGNGIAGFLIDKYIIHRLLPNIRYLRVYRISSIVFCSIAAILFSFPAAVLGIAMGGFLGGAIGSLWGKYGTFVGIFVFVALFMTIIPIIGALLGAFAGAFMENLVRGLLKLAKR